MEQNGNPIKEGKKEETSKSEVKSKRDSSREGSTPSECSEWEDESSRDESDPLVEDSPTHKRPKLEPMHSDNANNHSNHNFTFNNSNNILNANNSSDSMRTAGFLPHLAVDDFQLPVMEANPLELWNNMNVNLGRSTNFSTLHGTVPNLSTSSLDPKINTSSFHNQGSISNLSSLSLSSGGSIAIPGLSASYAEQQKLNRVEDSFDLQKYLRDFEAEVLIDNRTDTDEALNRPRPHMTVIRPLQRQVTTKVSNSNNESYFLRISLKLEVLVLGYKLSPYILYSLPTSSTQPAVIEVRRDLLLPYLKYYTCGLTNTRPDKTMRLWLKPNKSSNANDENEISDSSVESSKGKRLFFLDHCSFDDFKKITFEKLFPDLTPDQTEVPYTLVLELPPLEIAKACGKNPLVASILSQQQHHLFVYKLSKNKMMNSSAGRDPTPFYYNYCPLKPSVGTITTIKNAIFDICHTATTTTTTTTNSNSIHRINHNNNNNNNNHNVPTYLLLPPEVVEHIFSYLLIFDWYSLIRVCKYFYAIGFSTSIWNRWKIGFDFKDYDFVDDNFLLSLPYRVSQSIKQLHLSLLNTAVTRQGVKNLNQLEVLWLHVNQKVPMETLGSFVAATWKQLTSLYTLMIVGKAVKGHHLVFLKMFGAKLKVLGLSYPLVDTTLLKALSYCTSLESLILRPLSANEESEVKKVLPPTCQLCPLDLQEYSHKHSIPL